MNSVAISGHFIRYSPALVPTGHLIRRPTGPRVYEGTLDPLINDCHSSLYPRACASMGAHLNPTAASVNLTRYPPALMATGKRSNTEAVTCHVSWYRPAIASMKAMPEPHNTHRHLIRRPPALSPVGKHLNPIAPLGRLVWRRAALLSIGVSPKRHSTDSPIISVLALRNSMG